MEYSYTIFGSEPIQFTAQHYMKIIASSSALGV